MGIQIGCHAKFGVSWLQSPRLFCTIPHLRYADPVAYKNVHVCRTKPKIVTRKCIYGRPRVPGLENFRPNFFFLFFPLFFFFFLFSSFLFLLVRPAVVAWLKGLDLQLRRLVLIFEEWLVRQQLIHLVNSVAKIFNNLSLTLAWINAAVRGAARRRVN